MPMTPKLAPRGWTRTSTLIGIAACAAGYSLINAFDDVAPQKLLGDDGGAPGVDSSLPDTSVPDTSVPVDAGPDAFDADIPDAFDAGPRGAIVVGGSAASD